jgi:hypothetical protein
MDEQRGNAFSTGSTYHTPFYSSNYNTTKQNSNPNRLISSNNNLTMSVGSEYDTEQEAINMIRNQNRKIQDLYEELEKKDIQRTQALQAMTQANEGERKEHIAMINELRTELEKERHRRDQLIQEKTLSLTQQVDELKQTANVLRQKIENQ